MAENNAAPQQAENPALPKKEYRIVSLLTPKADLTVFAETPDRALDLAAEIALNQPTAKFKELVEKLAKSIADKKYDLWNNLMPAAQQDYERLAESMFTVIEITKPVTGTDYIGEVVEYDEKSETFLQLIKPHILVRHAKADLGMEPEKQKNYRISYKLASVTEEQTGKPKGDEKQ